LPILKSTDSAFRDFHRDQYTTLPDTDDRILATLLTAAWSYANGDHDWNKLYAQIKERLLAVFAAHRSLGVQHTLHAMGAAVLESIPVAEEIELKMPNRHRILFNMEPFGRVNPDQVYVTTDEPFGTISARLRRQ
jgi:urate oxidase